MKVVILAGGMGTRLSEETGTKPKPMVNIGEQPMLWHIMKLYSHHGFNEFIICCGYKGHMIKDYFCNYTKRNTDITVNLRPGLKTIEYHSSLEENWRVTLVDTGSTTMTGGRILRVKDYVDDEPFMVTYGDGLSDIDLLELAEYHREHEKMATVTAIQTAGRFGALSLEPDKNVDFHWSVRSFNEKPVGDGSWINGGFFIFTPEVFTYLRDGDNTVLERTPMENMAKDGKLKAYKHSGFWKCMDTIRDMTELNYMWESGKAPWKMWRS